MRPLLARHYDRFTAAMEDAWLDDTRAELLASASGAVVEIGAGTGKNLPHYGEGVQRVVLTEPTAAMRDQLRANVHRAAPAFTTEIVDATADELPLPSASIDTAVSTLVLCSVPDPTAAATELRRVLKPGGRLVVVEHVAATNARERRWQHRLDRAWNWIEGSCHLDQDTPAALETAGFDVSGLERRRPSKQPPLFRDVVVGVAVAR